MRHIYGKEGRGKAWAARSCQHIQQNSIGGDSIAFLSKSSVLNQHSNIAALRQRAVHGCPFVRCTRTSIANLILPQIKSVDREQHTNSEGVASSLSNESGNISQQGNEKNHVAQTQSPVAAHYSKKDHVEKMLFLSRQSCGAACRYHFSVNMDTLGQGEQQRTYQRIGIGKRPESYFNASVQILQTRQNKDVVK